MRNRPYGFEIYLVNVKTIRTISQIFVAFSEKLNFNGRHLPVSHDVQAYVNHRLYPGGIEPVTLRLKG